MVIYDGECLVTSYSRSNYKQILKLAQDYEGEFYEGGNVFAFPPSRNLAFSLQELGLTFDDSAKIWLKEKNKIPTNGLKLPDNYYSFQKDNINFFINNKRNILFADDCGTGKTISMSGYLKYAPKAFPCLIVCPSTIKTNWSKEIKKWVGKDSLILSGLNSFDEISDVDKAEVIIINYEILARENEKDKVHYKKLKSKLKDLKEEFDDEPSPYLQDEIQNLKSSIKNFTVRVEGWCDVLNQIEFNTVILDECQYIENDSTTRSRAVRKICEGKDCKIIGASATPFETKPSQLFNVVNLLNPDMFPDKYKYLYRYCDPKRSRFGWTFDGLTNGDELHKMLNKFMIRHRMEDVLPELPELNTQAIYIDVEPKDRKKYDQMDNDYINVPSEEKSAYISELKQELTKAKLPSCIEWIEDYLSSGKKLVVGIYYKETFDILMEHFKKIAVGINGETPQNKRDGIVEKFQTDDSIKLFIGQIKSSGTGITLVASDTVVFLEIGQTVGQMEQMSKRVKRIGQKSEHCNAIYLLLADSIDDDRFPVLEGRSKNSQTVMDGKVLNEFCNLDDAVRINWIKRHQQG